ncbi:rod shape-determining protein MreC [Candidatus Poribacteria bacterium]|nr:rod shape-determining protein MreC [Candidatus Poribacteria bacterium]
MAFTQPKRRSRRAVLIGLALVAGSFVLAGAQRHGVPGEGAARSAGAGLMTPFLNIGTWIHGLGTRLGSGPGSLAALGAENERLREELADLQIERAYALDRAQTAEATMDLFAALPEVARRTVAARVLGPVLDGRRRRVWINRGMEQGIQTGQTGLGPHGVIGMVSEAHDGEALVQLLTDEESRWGGEVPERAESGVVCGAGDSGVLEFRMERTATDVAPGDVVRTSGRRGSTVPAGLPIGTVRDVSVDKTGERRAVLEVPEDGGELKVVFVVAEGGGKGEREFARGDGCE